MRFDLGYIEDRKIDLEDFTTESLRRLIINLEIFLALHDLFDEFYGEDE